MKPLILIAALSLSACNTIPSNPVAPIAQATTLDEKAATAFELAYTAAARSAVLARQAKLISDQRWPVIQEYDRRAYTALLAVRAAYKAGNATSVAIALAQAETALRTLILSVK